MKTTFLTILLALSFMGASAQEQYEAFRDVNLPMHERIMDLLERMTFDEEISLLTATSPGIPRLNIDKYYHGNECLHGVVRPGNHTVFPQAIGLASMWNPQLQHDIAVAISDEARAQWHSLDNGRQQTGQFSDLLTFWSPTVNMARDPRWGRTPETYGEDPYLSGVLGTAFVRGLQGDDPRYLKVVSTPKHFAANNEENTRMHCNAIISEKQMREYYLPAFERCIKEGRAEAIMAAYNGINDTPCHANPWLLRTVLRNDWGFNGYVVTDCGGLENLVNTHKFVREPFTAAMIGIKSGIDLECGDNIYMVPLKEAYERDMVTKAEVDSAAYHVLRARMKLGLFDPVEMNPYSKIPVEVIGCEKHSQLALEAARQSLILLKNDKNTLPLNTKKIKKIGVLGINTEHCEFGDYSGTPVVESVSILEGIRKRCGKDVEVLYAPWVNKPTGFEELSADIFEDGIKETYYKNNDFSKPLNSRSVQTIYYHPANQAPNALAPSYPYKVRWSASLVAPATGEYTFRFESTDHNNLFLDKEEKLYKVWDNPCDSVKVTLQKGQKYEFWADFVTDNPNSECHMYWKTPDMKTNNLIENYGKAEEVLRNSDVAVVVLGTNMSIEREGLDRQSIDLPAAQKTFIEECYKVNPNIVVVLAAGSPMSINWVNDNIPAILNTWYGGQAGGTAVAEALFGDYNPGGRLPVTYYKSPDDLPDFHDYDITNGRTYQYFKGEPLYPFGYGLSYTSFQYSNAKAEVEEDSIRVSFNLKNTGKRKGEEVAQVYVRYVDGANDASYPLKQLKGFSRVALEKGQKKNVVINIAREDIRFWDEGKKAFVTPQGRYELFVGPSSANEQCKLDIRL